MKNIINYIALVTIVLALFMGCQETEIVEIDIPYSEYKVIYGTLEPEEAFKGIKISRTLPLNQSYNSEVALIENANVFLKLDGTFTIPLLYEGNGIYKPYNSIYPECGQQYELFVEIDESNFYSKTVIPALPSIRKAKLSDNKITVEMISKPGESYGALWAFLDSFGNIKEQSEDFQSITEAKSNNNVIVVETKDIPEERMLANSRENLRVVLYAFDEDYAAYFNSKSLNSSIENALTQGGSPIFSNIAGENVIGSFSAYAFTIQTVR